ncbi:MAG: response regulator [Elusimicrobiota bacterium]
MSETIDVLVIEDSPTQAEQLQHTLEGAGYRTSTVKNGREGLAFLKQRKARVVLSDISMPEMDGYAFCKVIKEDPDLKDIPVILMTSLIDPKDIIHGLECGASNFFTKPIDTPQLISRIKYIFANHAIRKSRGAQIPLDFIFAGKQYRLDADRMQILDLLLSTYEAAVEKNVELIRAQKELKQLNEALEARVLERTAALTATNAELRAEITHRNQADQRYRTLFDASIDGIVIADSETRALRHANPAMCRLLGYTETELEALKVDDLHPKDALSRFSAEFEAVVRGKEIVVPNIPCLRKDGTIIQADIAAHTLIIDGRACVVGQFRDVTERNLLQRQLLQAQKMESVGRLAGGVAHDFNNLLTAIGGYSHFLLASLAPDDKRRDDVEQIKKAGDRASSLTRQLLAFSRQQVLQTRVLDCNALVADMEKMLRRIIGEDVELATALSPKTGRIKADPGQIEQVLLNLVVNAKDAMPKGGKITIETSNIDLKEDFARMRLQVKPGPYVMFAVADTGTGMDSGTLAHLFEPFFTTKEQGKGTGLGLATVYGIVKQSGGGIYVYSEPAHGTTFKVYFPRIEDAVQPAQERALPAKPLVGSETILIVEDDEMVRAFIQRALREGGYSLLVARDPEEAIRLCRQQEQPIHLILTDVVMPQMHGPELMKLLAPLHPESKVIYMSGYIDTTMAHHDLVDTGVHFLQKPLASDVLARKVREVLDTPI